MKRCFGAASLFFALSLIAAGCSSSHRLYHPHIATSQQEAGEVHIARGSIAPWNDYVDAMQPQFTVTADSALQAALPTTSIQKQSVSDAFSLGVQVGLAQTTNTLSRSISTSSGTAATSSSDNSATNPGSLPPSNLTATTPVAASALAAVTGTPKTDAITQYSAATAIYQEIQLLNRYVKDAAQQHGYVPYVMRIPVAVEPFARDEPYDVYVDAGTFVQCGGDRTTAKPVSVIPLLVTDDLEMSQASNTLDTARQLALSLGGIASNVAFQSQVQSLLDSYRSVLGNEYNSLFSVTRGGADNVLHVRIGAVTSPNSEYATVTQTHNVTVLLLVPPDMAPEGESCSKKGPFPRINVSTLVTFRNAVSGSTLPNNAKLLLDRATKLYGQFVPNPSINGLYGLVPPVEEVDIAGFKKEICKQNPNYCDDDRQQKDQTRKSAADNTAEALWTAVSAVIAGSNFSETFVELPTRPTGAIEQHLNEPGATQVDELILLNDSGDSATANISGFGSIPASQLSAELMCSDKQGLYATSISQDASAGILVVKFPSLQPFGTACGVPDEPKTPADPAAKKGKGKKSKPVADAPASPPKVPLKNVSLVVGTSNDRWKTEDGKVYKFPTVYYQSGPLKADNSFSVTAGVDTLLANPAGVASVRLFVSGIGADMKDVLITFDGASTVSSGSLSSQATIANGQLKVTAPAVSASTPPAAGSKPPQAIDVILQGVVPGRPVKITATGESSKKGSASSVQTIYLQVIAPPQPRANPQN